MSSEKAKSFLISRVALERTITCLRLKHHCIRQRPACNIDEKVVLPMPSCQSRGAEIGRSDFIFTDPGARRHYVDNILPHSAAEEAKTPF